MNEQRIASQSGLLSACDAGDRVLVTFAGQGSDYIASLRGLRSAFPGARRILGMALQVLDELARDPAIEATGCLRAAPPYEQVFETEGDAEWQKSPVSHPLIFMAQAVRWEELRRSGLRERIEKGAIAGTTGHSQGILAACFIAELGAKEWSDELFLRYLRYSSAQGVFTESGYVDGAGARGTLEGASPMLAVSGVRRHEVHIMLQRFAKGRPESAVPSIGLVNSPNRFVLCGTPASLVAFRDAIDASASKAAAKKKKGMRPGRIVQPTWEFLPLSGAFHSHWCEPGMQPMREFVAEHELTMRAEDFAFPVFDCSGQGSIGALEEDATERVMASQFLECVDWPVVLQGAAREEDVQWVLEVGPGAGLANLTRSSLAGFGVGVLAVEDARDREAILDRGPAHRPRPFSDWAPRVRRGIDGVERVRNAFTDATGRSPVILPGMTPTTVDVPICAAAANAGFVAELAGGGQVNAAVFDERMEELTEALEPGAEVVFNALYLDRYLWGLHFEKEGLVWKHARRGAPLCGVTVSAGIPETDEAVALLDALADAGLWLNAFKPGTPGQVRQIIQIARAARHHTIFVHLEGGKAGGHHSWEDLDDLLLDTYPALRREPNLILCVGGGIRDEGRTVELLSGAWSEPYGRVRMPVDAVLLGTVTMACAEASATAAVKAALAESPGTESWVTPGKAEGGVTSGKSQLDADIHYIDNAASRCGRLLDQVAGDVAAVEARRDEIVLALSKTAKPYFGDLAAMSWTAVLERFVERCAIGKGGRYDDGCWPDVSFRERMRDLVLRAEARAAGAASRTEPVLARALEDFDDPSAVIAAAREAWPVLDALTLLPADVDWFVAALCRRPGKPVPFVPVIDADVRRWYKSDSLWQAQHDAYSADEVLIIPGPEAVTGIERADEPVAELLERYEAALTAYAREHTLPELPAPPPPAGIEHPIVDGRQVYRFSDESAGDWREHLRRRHPHPAWEVLLAARWSSGARSVLNPLRVFVTGRAGDEIIGDDAGWEYRPDGASGERITATGDAEKVSVEVALSADESPRRFVLRSVHRGGARHWALDVDADREASRAFYTDVLFGSDHAATSLFEVARDRVTLDAKSGRDYARASGQRGHEVSDARLFSVAWSALFSTLSASELIGGFEQLVHASNHVERFEALAWGDTLEVEARVSRLAHSASAQEVDVAVRFARDGVEVAHMTSRFAIRGDFSGAAVRERRERVWRERFDGDHGRAAWLAKRLDARFTRAFAGGMLELEASGTLTRGSSATLEGSLSDSQGELATLSMNAEGAFEEHPLEAALLALGVRDDGVRPRPPRTLMRLQDRAPRRLDAFARAGGDANPIHRSLLFARRAGFDRPIVHGMWTNARLEAFLRDDVLRGREGAVESTRCEFLAPLFPAEPITLVARRVGMGGATLRIDVEALAERDTPTPVARLQAIVRAPRTAWLFPGQGIQRQGMGMEAMQRSAAARNTWLRADAHTRDAHGFSILHIVKENPTRLDVRGYVYRHPSGVIHLTQFTQVAMAVMAQAQVAELRESGFSFEGDVTAGHSVGEYNALAALAGVISLEQGLDAVYQRGLAMHRLVPRDADGVSGYGMGVVRPHYAGLGHQEVEELVERVCAETNAFAQIVNYNVRGRQYAVTGEVKALAALRKVLAELAPSGGKDPWVDVPGIDVPFHSRVLRAGVEAFRASLRSVLDDPMDVTPLVGRYVPNLVPRPFSLDRAYIEEVATYSESPVLAELLASWKDGPAPEGAGRKLLIELLAYQFASPVRWIETQELLFDPAALGIERIVEVGLGSQPTVANMARYSRSLMGGLAEHVDVFNAEADADAVSYADADPAPESVAEDAGPPAPDAAAQAPVEPAPAAPSAPNAGAPNAGAPNAGAPNAGAANAGATNASAPDDVPGSVLGALRALLANQAKLRPEQIALTETIDEIFDGASARRNQALMDIGNEFAVGSVDGAHEMPLSALAAAIESRGGSGASAGAYLSAMQDSALQRVGARAGMSRRDVEGVLESRYGLGPGWTARAMTQLALETRPGPSVRGGDLGVAPDASPASKGDFTALLDEVVAGLGRAEGVTLAPLAAGGGGGGGAAVDARVVEELEARVLGSDGALAQWARDLLERVDDDAPMVDEVDPRAARIAERIVAEFGEDFVKWISPRFDASRHVVFAQSWSHAQRDVVALFADAKNDRLSEEALRAEALRLAPHGRVPRVAATARWCAERSAEPAAGWLRAVADEPADTPVAWTATRPSLAWDETGARYEEARRGRGTTGDIVRALFDELEHGLEMRDDAAATDAWRTASIGATHRALPFGDDIALVTGASPGSIAVEIVRHLLRGGARVVVTTTSYHDKRLAFYRRLYQQEATGDAELHVVPFNQASAEDAAALIDWLFARITVTEGATVREVKPPLAPTIVVPFGAMGDLSTLDGVSGRSEAALRATLVGVERLVTGIGAAYRAQGLPEHPCFTLLPLSPNHGSFGGDGFYAEAKAALEAMLHKERSERDAWGAAMALCGARIGWCRGTGLMDANNPLAAMLERDHELRTFSAAEMGHVLVALCSRGVRRFASEAPLYAKLDAGMAQIDDLRERIDGARADIEARTTQLRELASLDERAEQLQFGTPIAPMQLAPMPAWAPAAPSESQGEALGVTLPLDEMIVIVGAGEVGPWGSARTRWDYETDQQLSPAGVLELAWITGLVEYQRDGNGGRWVDVASGDAVDEADIATRYHDAVIERSGIRVVEPEVAGFDPDDVPVLATAYLDRDLTFRVGSEEDALSFVRQDPEHTRMRRDEQGEWSVTRRAGAAVRVPRSTAWRRHVAGLVPSGFDAKRYGIPAEMVESVDRVTLFALIASVEAFLDAGLTPEELLEKLHPTRVGNCIGSGIGGMDSLRRLYHDELLDRERQSDVIQETLINVVAGYVVQSYVGSYGPISCPVAACATAAVSLETAFDKIRAGKADFMVAGGFDDIGEAGVRGFGDMNATADTRTMIAQGISPSSMCRPNDVRRGGFLESHGGGTFLVTRGDIARDLGLPVRAVVGWVGSFSDGIHASVPAPGIGAVASAQGGATSPMGRALTRLGLCADDIRVAYKHDTSTRANDPNENQLHQTIQRALSRTPGAPLFVVSQKSVTGHSKGGAAAFQIGGAIATMASGQIAGNANLETVDPSATPHEDLVFSDRLTSLGPAEPVRASLVTSLGFGHVGALALLAHPAVFEAGLSDEERTAWREGAQRREQKSARRREAVLSGSAPLYSRRTDARLPEPRSAHESAMLLDASWRFRASAGTFGPGGDTDA